MKKIAIIGTGIMGNGMAVNFLKHDHQVFVWNRSKEKLKNLVDAGAVEVATPKEAAEKADLVFEVTANDESSKRVWLEADGILAGAKQEGVYIPSATLSLDWINELAAKCRKRKMNFFDMPLTGGRSGAENGQLILLVGGHKALLEKLKPDLQHIAKEIIYFGKTGSGIAYKLILNMLQGIHVAAFGEAMAIAKEQNMDLDAVGNALANRLGGPTASQAWPAYQRTPENINFAAKWITKDLTYAKKLAGETKAALLEQALKKYQALVDAGKGEQDWTEVNKS